MSYKISKELFEAVKGFEVIEFYCKKEIQYYPADKERVRCLNWVPVLNRLEYNDFFFTCKEWLEETTSYDIVINEDNVMLIYDLYAKGGIYIHEFFGAKDVKQSLFDACQYVLNNKDKQ